LKAFGFLLTLILLLAAGVGLAIATSSSVRRDLDRITQSMR
jgi:hypothetical protein